MRPRKDVLYIGSTETSIGLNKFVLETRGHFRVVIAVDVTTALEAFRARRPDLVLCELEIPGGGACLTDMLKAVDATVPVIVSSRTTNDFQCAGVADSFLPKGHTIAEMLECAHLWSMRKRGPKKHEAAAAAAAEMTGVSA